MMFTRLAALTTLVLPLLAVATPVPQGDLVCCDKYVPASSKEAKGAVTGVVDDLLTGVTATVDNVLGEVGGLVGLGCMTPHVEGSTSAKTCAVRQQPAICKMNTASTIAIGCVIVDLDLDNLL